MRVDPSPLSGEVMAIASKSDVHRAMICAALADAPTDIRVGGGSRDIDATRACLESLGATFTRCGDLVRVEPIARAASTSNIMDCGESGSTLRFLMPIVPALGMARRVVGHGRLPERPLGDLSDALERRGAVLSSHHLPFDLSGLLTAGRFDLPGDVSSQYITGLLFALPLLSGDSEIRLSTELESSGYVEMTLRTLSRFGIEVVRTDRGWRVRGPQTYRSPSAMDCEGDWSNAAFFLAAGAIGEPGSTLTVSGLDMGSAQGDREIFNIIERFGATMSRVGDNITVCAAPLHGVTIDAAEIPDLVPVLAVVATYAQGETVIANAARLRAKESDRLSSTSAALRALGCDCRELPDGLVVRGSRPAGGTVDCCGDHRIAMSMAVAASMATGSAVLCGAESCEKSYPAFFDDFKRLGGRCDVV